MDGERQSFRAQQRIGVRDVKMKVRHAARASQADLSDDVAERLPVERHTFMQAVGLIEIAAGLLVAAKPKWGGYVVSAWLAGIVANLWTQPEYRDIALRDVGLALGALALARMAADAPRERVAELPA